MWDVGCKGGMGGVGGQAAAQELCLGGLEQEPRRRRGVCGRVTLGRGGQRGREGLEEGVGQGRRREGGAAACMGQGMLGPGQGQGQGQSLGRH